MIAYILARFPNLTETFILNEIIALRTRGLNVGILSIENSNDNRQQITHNLIPLCYYDKHFSLNKFVAHIYMASTLRYKYFMVLFQLLMKANTIVGYLDAIKKFSISVFFLYQLRKYKVDIIHAHFLDLPTTVALTMSKLSKLPYSCSAHAHDIYTGKIEDISEKIAACKFIVTCTAANKQYLSNVCQRTDQYKIVHIYHGIEGSKWDFLPFDNEFTKPVRILSVGRLVEKKGFRVLLQAISLLTKRGVEVECSIIGDGPLLNQLKSIAAELNIEKIITFYGSLSHNDVKTFYKSCDFFVLASEISGNGDRDGLPNVLLEALAQGIPVVTTRVSAIPELVVHNYSGILVDAGDSLDIANQIIKLISDRNLRHYLSRNGRDLIEKKFDLNNSIVDLEYLFSNL